MKKKILAPLVLLGMVLLLAGCHNAEQTCEGTIMSCTPIEQDKVLLLYNNKVYPSPNEAPINEDTLCIYDLSNGKQEIIAQENNLYENYNDQIIISPSQILYNNSNMLWEFTNKNGKWETENHTSNNLKVLSPSGEKIVERQDEAIIVTNRQNNEVLAQTSDIHQATVMCWEKGEQQLAIIADASSAIVLWDLKTNKLQRLQLGQELPDITNWVDIINLSYTADGQYLLGTILCENSTDLIVIDTASATATDWLTISGDVTLLDTDGSKILYSVTESQTIHYLNIYNCQNQSITTIDQDSKYYLAACFIDEQHILVNKFDINSQENNLIMLNI